VSSSFQMAGVRERGLQSASKAACQRLLVLPSVIDIRSNYPTLIALPFGAGRLRPKSGWSVALSHQVTARSDTIHPQSDCLRPVFQCLFGYQSQTRDWAWSASGSSTKTSCLAQPRHTALSRQPPRLYRAIRHQVRPILALIFECHSRIGLQRERNPPNTGTLVCV
jgi:hypothetical protein